MPEHPETDGLGSLARAREQLYTPNAAPPEDRDSLPPTGEHTLPHAWEHGTISEVVAGSRKRVRLAALFFAGSAAVFVVALGISAYLLYFGGNSISVNNVALTLQGPTTIAGGDTVPLSVTVTNRNFVAIENATLEMDFPDGTRSADNVLTEYPRYTENLGSIAPGATVTRSVKAVIFGGEGQSLSFPVSLSYGTGGSNAVFVKKTAYALGISSTPLSVSVEAPVEAVSGKLFTFTLTARSNASIPINNIVLTTTSPFGFSLASSTVPMQNSAFLIGTLKPGETKTIRMTGMLSGENASVRVFHFALGTASGPGVGTISVAYMQQDASITLAAPFISTTIALNGNTSGSAVLAPNTRQNATLSYTNTLGTIVTNAAITVALSGGAIDYNSIEVNNGFYQSSTHSILFSRDTDSSFASLAPGASGIGTFSFVTLPSSVATRDSLITLTTSVSGTRLGQTNVPETVSASSISTAKVSTVVALSASALHSSGPFTNTGPIPPTPGMQTTYSILWQIQGGGNAVAGATVSATLPSYVSYTGKTSGTGNFTYDSSSHTVTWNAGDLAAGALAQGAFQVSLTPSTSQKGNSPTLTSAPTLAGFDRYAQVNVSAQAAPSTTETPGDPGYVATNGDVR